jgi:hypothetical protein
VPNCVGSFSPFTWGRKQVQFPKCRVFYSLEYRSMKKVQKSSNSVCYTPSSEPFRIEWIDDSTLLIPKRTAHTLLFCSQQFGVRSSGVKVLYNILWSLVALWSRLTTHSKRQLKKIKRQRDDLTSGVDTQEIYTYILLYRVQNFCKTHWLLENRWHDILSELYWNRIEPLAVALHGALFRSSSKALLSLGVERSPT